MTMREEKTADLVRGLGLWQATALNIANMIGVGPFITIPLFLATMGGPQALIGWLAAAVLVICDGLVWSELGAALPGSGGTYHYLREIFGRCRFGRLLPFLFIWQFRVVVQFIGQIVALHVLRRTQPDVILPFRMWCYPLPSVVALVG